MLLSFVQFPSFPVLIVFLFFFRSRTLLLARRTCRRRKHFCDGPRKRPTSTPESMSKTSLSHGGTVSPSMPSSTETGAQILSQPSLTSGLKKQQNRKWTKKEPFLLIPCEGVSLSAATLWFRQIATETPGNWPSQRPNLSHYLPLL